MSFFWFKPVDRYWWPKKCKVKFCYNRKLRPHHHHLYADHIGGIDPIPCICANPHLPGTRE